MCLSPLSSSPRWRIMAWTALCILAYLQGPAVDANPPRSIKLNCVGTTNVFEAARMQGAKRVVYASSMGVYSIRRTPGRPGGRRGLPSRWPIPLRSLQTSERGSSALLSGAPRAGSHRDASHSRVWHRTVSLSRLRSHGHSKMLVADLTAGGLVAVPGALLQGESVQMPPDDQIVDWVYAP